MPGFPGGVETVGGKQCLKSMGDHDVTKLAMSTCIETMALLMGKQTLLGTLKSIVDLVDDPEHGPDNLPGKCCFDTPTTEGRNFGLHVSGALLCCHFSSMYCC